MISSTISNRIKELRIERGLTIDQVVLDINTRYELQNPLHKSMISKWENGLHLPTLENAKYLALYYDVSIDYLVGLTDSRVPSRLFKKVTK